jgi:hypothetical protein
MGWLVGCLRLQHTVRAEAGQTAVKSGGGDIGVRQSVHRSKILCRNVAAERTEGGARTAAAGARSAVSIGVDLAV